MKDTGSDSPGKNLPKPDLSQQGQGQPGSGTFTSFFGFAKNTFNRTLNLG